MGGTQQSKFGFVDFQFPRKSPEEKVSKSIYIKQSIQNDSKYFFTNFLTLFEILASKF